MIKFNEPFYTGNELNYIKEIMDKKRLQGNSDYNAKINEYLKDIMKAESFFLVHSCTAALEIAALALDIKPGDEVIMPSFTYVSSANAFVLRGAKIIFVDVDEETMNINLDELEKAITEKTKVVVPVHYGGVSCDMDRLIDIADKHNISIVEDAAQALFSKYKGRYLGTIGKIGCISLHETKNITSGGEGGILLINDKTLIRKVEMIVEKGTDRIDFLNGNVERYTWKGIGSSYLMSQLNSGFLQAQLESGREITRRRNEIFDMYKNLLSELINKKTLSILEIPNYNEPNGHMFFIKVKNETVRNRLTEFLKNNEIEAVSHYEPLHTSAAGLKYGKFVGSDNVTSRDSKRLLRLPLHMYLSSEDINEVVNNIKEFYDNA